MKTYLIYFCLVIICSAFINSSAKKDTTFEKLYLLEGKWIMKTKNGFIGEEWKKINMDYLQNRGYMIRGNDTIITERVALRNSTDGIDYISTVENQNNQQPIAFRLTSSENNLFVFENRLHDFPKKITYNFINKDSICAWIDDGKELPEKKSTFRYSRQK